MNNRPMSGFLSRFTVVLILLSALVLWGCDDDDNFEDVDASEIAGKTYVFTDARAFELPNQPATLSIGLFGTEGRQSDDAPFTLISGTATIAGTLDLNKPTIPIGSNVTDCNFRIDSSPFDMDGLRPGDTISTECRLTRGDETELQITNKDTDQVSTGTRQ